MAVSEDTDFKVIGLIQRSLLQQKVYLLIVNSCCWQVWNKPQYLVSTIVVSESWDSGYLEFNTVSVELQAIIFATRLPFDDCICRPLWGGSA